MQECLSGNILREISMKHSEALIAERRAHARIERPQLYIRVAEHVYRAIEWSYSGFVLEDELGNLAPGALLRIDGLVAEEGYRHGHSPEVVDILARVLRAIPEQSSAALTCLKLDDVAYRILRAIEGSALSIAANQA